MIRALIVLLVTLGSLGAPLGAQEVGKPMPEVQTPKDKSSEPLVPTSEFVALTEHAYVSGQPWVYVFVKSMDEPSAKLLAACNAALAVRREKYFRIYGLFPAGTDVTEAKAFLNATDSRFTCWIESPGEYDAWAAVAKRPVAVVIESNENPKILFVGSEGLGKAIDDAVAASKQNWRRLENSPKAVKEALVDVAAAKAKLKIDAACKAAATAAEKFAGTEDEKEQVQGTLRYLEDEWSIEAAMVQVEMRKYAMANDWIRIREILTVYEYTFDAKKEDLEKMLKTLVDEYKAQNELKLQDELQKLQVEKASKPRKERSKALRDFAKKNKGTQAAVVATAKAEDLDLVEKKMGSKSK